VVSQEIGDLLAKHPRVQFQTIHLSHFLSCSRVNNGQEWICVNVVVVDELFALGRVEIDLAEDEIRSDYLFHGLIAPYVSIQALTLEITRILNVQQEPFVHFAALSLCLFTKKQREKPKIE
jgi:hypothetical protein